VTKQIVAAPAVEPHRAVILDDLSRRAAKRATIAGMSWHHIPKDDAWEQAHLGMLASLGKRAWLHCDGCRHSIMIEPHELAQRHWLDMRTLLLTIPKAMRCTLRG
jgi:hypothetical protein